MGCGIAFPANPVLEGSLLSDSFGPDYFFHFVLWFPFYDIGGWFDVVGSMGLGLNVGGEEVGVKNIVYAPVLG